MNEKVLGYEINKTKKDFYIQNQRTNALFYFCVQKSLITSYWCTTHLQRHNPHFCGINIQAVLNFNNKCRVAERTLRNTSSRPRLMKAFDLNELINPKMHLTSLKKVSSTTANT